MTHWPTSGDDPGNLLRRLVPRKGGLFRSIGKCVDASGVIGVILAAAASSSGCILVGDKKYWLLGSLRLQVRPWLASIHLVDNSGSHDLDVGHAAA